MLADLTTNRLNGAVQLCLQQCYRSDNPIASLAQYTANLRQLGWDEAEIEELEIVVRRILGRVLKPIRHHDKMPQSGRIDR
jgi:hypothetical protein